MKNFSGADLKRIACIILASGSGRRFGGNKLTAELCGRPLISYIIEATSLFPCRTATTRSVEVAELCRKASLPCVLHNGPFLNDSIALGTKAALKYFGPDLAGFLFCQGDQPFLHSETLLRLCWAFLREPSCIHRLSYQGEAASPVLFPAAFAKNLQELPRDEGGSFLIKKYPELLRYTEAREKIELIDIDTLADLSRYQNKFKKS